MNTQLVSLLFVISSLSAPAFAEGLNLPEAGSPAQAGRILAFPSVKGVTWFLASGLSSTLDCSGGGFSNRVCSVKVFNTVTDKEEAALRALTPAWGQFDGFRDFNTNIVTSIDERFESLAAPLDQAHPLIMRTLAVSNQSPYASLLVRISTGDGDVLQKAYDTVGLGNFVSEVTLRGESTETYLALREIDAIRDVLNRCVSSGGMKGSALKAALKSALNQVQLVRQGLEADEAQIVAYEQVLRTFFKLAGRGRYQVRQDRLPLLQEGYVIVDETYAPVTMKCRIVLPLKKNAVSTAACQPQEGV